MDEDLATQAPLPPARRPALNETKKCWICFCDSTEDVPSVTSPWRTPCPCALTAHEACLLDWIADLEAPPTSSTQSRIRKDKIECPQCKAEIRIARPWSPVVAGVRAVERIGGTLVLPGIASLLMGGVFSACFVHGAVSMFLILGPDDWEKLIGNVDGRGARAGMKVVLGLPTVPIVLILSRTKLVDGIFPLLPLALYGPQLIARGEWHRLIDAAYPRTIGANATQDASLESAPLWPPDLAMTFAILPYLRAIYNIGYTQIFAAKEMEWTRAVQRELRTGETEVQRDEGPEQRGERLEFEAEIVFGDNNAMNQDLAAIQANLENEPAVAEDDGMPVGEAQIEADDINMGFRQEPQRPQRQQGQAPAQEQRQDRQQQNNGLIVSASRILDNVLGALCFPAIASIMGEVLKLALPAKLTGVAQTRRPGSFPLLHTKWGRSVVGGCLFVVMKDAVVLYSRYRLAQDHKKRRVLDYNGPGVRSAR